MEIKDLVLPAINQFASDYISGRLKTDNFFHYDINDEKVYEKRYSDLMNRHFYRKDLADHIRQYMDPFGINDAVRINIEALTSEGSAVVIGGQQAGLLSGPLYTIHKALSVIKLAEQQEKALNKKVIPVFWIAGEDHDIQEVNHVYTMQNGKPDKVTFPMYITKKPMVSDVKLDYAAAVAWVEKVIESYGETNYTNELLQNVKKLVEESSSFSDFFARLMHAWFKGSGLLLIDAADPGLRKLETEYFTSMIKNAEFITDAVLSQQNLVEEAGYKKAIDIHSNAANLFYYDSKNQERTLLELDGKGNFIADKTASLSFTQTDMLQMAETRPESLSNNVVTRPIMQESLFPVLAFIAGPGEAAYWAELKQAFELFDMKMPPIVPRLNLTIVERSIETDLNELAIPLETALTGKTNDALDQYLKSIEDETLVNLHQKLIRNLEESHGDFAEQALKIDGSLRPLLDKNREFIQKQLDFIYEKTDEMNRRKHHIVINKYERITASLHPLNSPQERIWNPFYYLNKYGPDFITDLAELEYEFNNKHKVIFL
ncbi:bacillithiol biosynthesis cysteine-adding enzyme BshC [Peribacillus deserti]|uniref:Putative cysteine ligase BshC n=1 Tax=Peribacillus deserti TaxID=673318 RepID=A0ABS2QGT3_9BACI|nr:bacillithiol biosynthesis cysteine-adding enzyme BshC [Peribacillus deserti]MBM7692372.1 bacillithiol biosynthesis cysteine-adding enzyme BshC [Peribacillus deserti]